MKNDEYEKWCKWKMMHMKLGLKVLKWLHQQCSNMLLMQMNIQSDKIQNKFHSATSTWAAESIDLNSHLQYFKATPLKSWKDHCQTPHIMLKRERCQVSSRLPFTPFSTPPLPSLMFCCCLVFKVGFYLTTLNLHQFDFPAILGNEKSWVHGMELTLD